MPATIAIDPLPDHPTLAQYDIFYALAEASVTCLADLYGEDRMLAYVRDQVHTAAGGDAARDHFGAGWPTVDGRCRAWMTAQAT
ncbi:hypothetical protein DFJ67_2162 [Asanoa ferruginea]|uniref:Uncharacterized protein n=1 Tax=Asanoa ferruginea TaxID=53367 RepID=A0A3D9ZR89_9ACTN|nr:hypothetical protein [Asanoa ferruginea]REF96190.1 hypothetical protein DFJ67_2162 [Asanoa ferruginea]GIF49339.1 hypothetical protein Afe04nite_38780 [Asanoa ferruginea]